MRYLTLVHKDPGSVYGVTIPDVPGCFAAGDTIEEALKNAADAIVFHLDGAPEPTARDVDALLADQDVAAIREGAVLAFVDTASQSGSPLLFEPIGSDAHARSLLARVDEAARERGISAGEFVRRALQKALADS